VLVALLIGGTLKLAPLTTQLWSADLAWTWAPSAQATLDRLLPVDALKGDEGLTLQGAVLIALLLLIAAAAWRGLGQVDESFSALTRVSLGLIMVTLVFAALSVKATPGGLHVAVTGRTLAVATLLAALLPLARRLESWDLQQWLWESWRFVRQIFPLLVVGVFVVGVIRVFTRPEWVQAVAGDNTVLGNLAGVVFGIFMYFPTLVEVPVARMLLTLGMHPGPLLAYLMADPELSLQSMLITAAIIGRRKTGAYVVLVALFATTSGLAFGAWSDGRSPWEIVLAVGGLAAVLTTVMYRLSRRQVPATT
jgi:uncharacterized membrane protein YraQ (UPF0718 family)